MRTPMTYPIRFWAVLLAALLIVQFSTKAFAESCKYEKTIEMTLDVASADSLSIYAMAGDLDVIGVPGSGAAAISGRACASRQEWLDASTVETRPGDRPEIRVALPETSGGWSLIGGNYAWIDLRIEVPADLALVVKDSSGDVFLKGTGEVKITDSSGDIEVENAGGRITVRDSSGDIDIDQVNGDVIIESDSSGDIFAENITGAMRVVRDSSGDIEARSVTGDVIVEKDSSGDINVRDVGGDFLVLNDGSGGIRSTGVSGEIKVPKKH